LRDRASGITVWGLTIPIPLKHSDSILHVHGTPFFASKPLPLMVTMLPCNKVVSTLAVAKFGSLLVAVAVAPPRAVCVGVGTGVRLGAGVNVGTEVGGAVTLNPTFAEVGSRLPLPSKLA
jgi:hypothetical protein